MSAAPLLSVDGVNAFYGESHILHDVSFDLCAGEIVGILGRNGVGKTTMLHTILGIVPPRTGQISFRAEPIAGKPVFDIVTRGIGWVPQGHRIFPTLSVVENLELAEAKARPGPWSVRMIYDAFPRLRARCDARGSALSGGEQQMLAIARALIQNPELFLMDEPSEALSPALVREVGSIVQKLNREGASILLVEQNLAFTLEVADRVLIMNKGSIVYSGAPAELRADPDVSQRFLGVGVMERKDTK
jgi:branched-chain amino acid transport system ATP-binding protein